MPSCALKTMDGGSSLTCCHYCLACAILLAHFHAAAPQSSDISYYVPDGDNQDQGVGCTGAGWYLDRGQCARCPIGFRCPAGETVAKPCETGTFQDMQNRASCRECDIGTYQDEQQKSSCKQCATGWTTSGTGRPACDSCIQGDYYKNGKNCTYRHY